MKKEINDMFSNIVEMFQRMADKKKVSENAVEQVIRSKKHVS